MAYELKRRSRLAHELAGIVARQFEKALDGMNGDSAGSADAVHEERKSVKKIRAVLRLLRKDLGNASRTGNLRLRAVARQLGSLRDADAILETMESVRDHYPRLVTPSTFAPIHRGLLCWKRRTVARLSPDRLLGRVARDLRRSATPTIRLIRRRVTGYASIRAGMIRGYGRARKAMTSVHANPEDAAFHAWRRRVKDHWYHMRLLEGVSAAAHARARRLKRLEEWLGDDHNLALLRTTILSAPSRFGGDRPVTVVLGCIATYQSTLRKHALRLGHRLFARRPKVFRRSVDGWWHRKRG